MSGITFRRIGLVDLWMRSQPFFEQHGSHHTIETLFNGDYYPDGVPLDSAGRTAEECEAQGDIFWPDPKRASVAAPRTLVLVGDESIYCLPNCNYEDSDTASTTDTLVYAEGFDPDENEGWWEAKRAEWGPDDGTFMLPPEWVDRIIKSNAKFVVFYLSENSVRLEFD